MRHIHHFKPIIAHGFEWRNPLANAIYKNFPAASRNRAKPRRFEIGNDLFERLIKYLAKMDELARAETVNVDCRESRFDVAKQIQIPLLGELWMMAALHQDLRAAESNGLL